MKKIYPLLLIFLFFSAQIVVRGQSLDGQVDNAFEISGSLKNAQAYDLLRLKIKNPYLFDATVIYFHSSFKKELGPEDSEKLFNSSILVPEIFTNISNKNLSINGFPLLEGAGFQLPVYVRNRVYDECEISSSVGDFLPQYSVVLEDKELSEYTNLREGSYKYTPSALGICSDRFVLHLSRGISTTTAVNSIPANTIQSVSVSSSAGAILVDVPLSWLGSSGNQAEIEIYNLTGQKIKEINAGAGSTRLDLPRGQIYLVRVAAGEKQSVKKVVVR